MNDWMTPSRPLSIAHRGASAYAPDCSLEAYRKAARLGADMWEVDIRMAACGTLIAFHDPAFPDGQRPGDLGFVEIAEQARLQNVAAVQLEKVLALAVQHGAGIYADIKDTAATLPTLEALKAHGIDCAILGAFDPEAAALLDAADCPYPRSVLVPVGADPFDYAKGADVIHLCWEHLDRPQDLLTPALFAEAEARGQKIALWHEEDPARMADLRHLPVLGICSDRPELVHPFKAPDAWPVQIACHRGANEFAPENTLSAAHCAFAAGFTFVELDVQQTADDELVAFHDVTLNRTTQGRGAVNWYSLAALNTLEAGASHDPFFAGEPIPTLRQMLDLGKAYGGQFYVELKHADPALVLDTVRAADMLDRCFFWAFDHSRLQALRAACPEARLMVRRQDLPDLDAALALSPEIVEFDLKDDLSGIADCKTLGLRSMVAYMGRDDACFRQLVDLRPDILNLHFPFLFRDFLLNQKIE